MNTKHPISYYYRNALSKRYFKWRILPSQYSTRRPGYNIHILLTELEVDSINEVDFADWAFGPNGLPRLEVLAFGDFSYEERYQKQRFLARRKHSVRLRLPGQRPETRKHIGWIFCIGDMNDPSLGSDVGLDGSKFLPACPDSGPMESPDEW